MKTCPEAHLFIFQTLGRWDFMDNQYNVAYFILLQQLWHWAYVLALLPQTFKEIVF